MCGIVTQQVDRQLRRHKYYIRYLTAPALLGTDSQEMYSQCYYVKPVTLR